MNVPRIASWAICAYVFYMIFFTMGCGSSDVEASMDTKASSPTESSMPAESPSSSTQQPTPVATASIGSAALVCSAAVPFVVIAFLSWPRPYVRRDQQLRDKQFASLTPVKRLTHR
jgi:hypothetical protein